MKIIGIVGSRRRNSVEDYRDIEAACLLIYEDGDWICSGGCPEGADRFAERIAKQHGIPILIFFPNWKKYGKAAGFIRNTFIADKSDYLIACVAKDRKGGTEDTIKKFQKSKPQDGMITILESHGKKEIEGNLL